jgi:hypothetical protein
MLASTSGQERSKEGGAGGEKPAAKADPATIARLIAQLGDNEFKKREEASRRLAELDEVPGALRRAAEGTDPEVARRARAAITIITDRAEERALRAILRDLHQVELDRLVRRMVTDKKFAGEKEWTIIQAVAKAVTAEASKAAGRRLPVPDFDVKSMPRLLLNAETKNPVSVRRSTVLSAGATPYITSVSNSLVIVDGDFTGATGIDNSLLIVRGNVGHVTGVRDSIILATGYWEGATCCDGSFAQVNNHLIRFTTARDSVLINTVIRTTGRTNSRTVTTDKGPLRLVKFSPRPSDARLAWGQEVDNLAVALAPIGADGQILIRWKNVGTDAFQLPWVRLNSRPIDGGRDDLLGHVILKGPDGKLAPARQPPAPGGGTRRREPCVILGPGRTHEELINLWSYVEKPAAGGAYQLSVELVIAGWRRGLEPGMKTWSGKIRSKAIDVPLGK